MRICNAFTDTKQKDIELKNKAFRFFKVRLTRYDGIPQTEYIYKGEVIDMRNIEAKLHNAMLQNEDWEIIEST